MEVRYIRPISPKFYLIIKKVIGRLQGLRPQKCQSWSEEIDQKIVDEKIKKIENETG